MNKEEEFSWFKVLCLTKCTRCGSTEEPFIVPFDDEALYVECPKCELHTKVCS